MTMRTSLDRMTKQHQFSNLVAVAEAVRRATINLIPPADILPSVWAERNVRIPVGNAKPGPIRFDNAPPQRGMIDVIKEPGIRRVAYDETEFCVILEGRVRLEGEGGAVEFGPGEAFVIEGGFSGTWESIGRVVKLYAILES